MPVDIEVGSGTHGKSFLTNHDGHLLQSPVSWYADGEQWGLSPGFVPELHERFERKVTHACISCHSGRANPHPSDPDRFDTPVFHEETIGCERCHGPGGHHIRFHESGLNNTESDPITRLSALSSVKQDAVCNQCHLQGRRRIPVAGQTEFSFRPGMHLNDVWTTVLKTEGVESGTAAAGSQVEQLYSSTCFLRSKGQLTCVTCHDPHRRPSADEFDTHYRTRCVSCHQSDTTECSEELPVRLARTSTDSCIVCHMPAFEASDVHSAQTDHRILRERPVEVETVARKEDEPAKVVLFEEPGAPLSRFAANRAQGVYLAELAYLNMNASVAREAANLLAASLKQQPADPEVLFAFGKALYQAGKPDMAVEAWRSADSMVPRHEDVLEAIASSLHQMGKPEEAKTAYEQLLDVNPHRSRYFGRMAHVLGQLGDLRNGVAAAERALELNPSLVQAHAWLADVYAQLGDDEKAKFHEAMVGRFKISGRE